MRDKPLEIQPIERIQENFLAREERRLLTWICSKFPAWVSPDMLTYLGMLGAVLIFSGYTLSNLGENWLWLAIAGYVIQWFGDSTDGSLARYRKIERPRYGYFLDHSCDGLTTTLVVVGIGLSPYVTLEVALIALAGYLLLSIHAFLSVRVLGELKLSYLNAGPTELRFLLIGLTLAMMVFGAGPGWFGSISGFDMFIGVVGGVLITLFVKQTAVTARRLAVEEPSRNDEWRNRRWALACSASACCSWPSTPCSAAACIPKTAITRSTITRSARRWKASASTSSSPTSTTFSIPSPTSTSSSRCLTNGPIADVPAAGLLLAFARLCEEPAAHKARRCFL